MAFNAEPSAIRVSRQLARMPHIQMRIARATGGIIPDDPSNPFTGPLVSDVAGRTDQINTHVPSGAYVIPADIVSSIGEGNSLSGLKVLQHMFTASPRNAPTAPYAGSAGPYGSSMPRAIAGAGEGIPRAPTPGLTTQSKGGRAKTAVGHPAPVVVAGGEFIIHPDDVAKIGGGSVDRGHKILDEWVKHRREETIKILKRLPGPAKS